VPPPAIVAVVGETVTATVVVEVLEDLLPPHPAQSTAIEKITSSTNTFSFIKKSFTARKYYL
jgi:hypothetical protein